MFWILPAVPTPTSAGSSSSIKELIGLVKDTAAAAQSVATIFALIVGAIWARRTVLRNRGEHAWAELTHIIEHHDLPSGRRLLIVDVFLRNKGNTPLRLIFTRTWVQQILPMPDGVQKQIEAGEDPVGSGELQVLWERLGEYRERDLSSEKYVVDSSEVEQFRHNFVVDSDVKVIQIYSYIEAKGENLGWKLTTTHDFTTLQSKGDVQRMQPKDDDLDCPPGKSPKEDPPPPKDSSPKEI